MGRQCDSIKFSLAISDANLLLLSIVFSDTKNFLRVSLKSTENFLDDAKTKPRYFILPTHLTSVLLMLMLPSVTLRFGPTNKQLDLDQLKDMPNSSTHKTTDVKHFLQI